MKPIQDMIKRIESAIPVERNGNLAWSSVVATINFMPVGHIVSNNYAGSRPSWTGPTVSEVLVQLGWPKTVEVAWEISSSNAGVRSGKIIVIMEGGE